MGDQVIIIEVDENQHKLYDSTCENRRLMEISQDIHHRPIVFIRFNPDDYYTMGNHIKSCWSYNKRNGIIYIPKKMQEEWNLRLKQLDDTVEYWYQHRTSKTINIVHLFFNTSDT